MKNQTNNPCADIKRTFKDYPQSVKQMRAKAEALWGLLDAISTAFDMHKPPMETFEKHVLKLCEKRNEHFTSDGWKLYATKA